MTYKLIKVILKPILMVVFRIRVRGDEHVPARGPLILASNHQSFIDSIFIPYAVPRRVTFLAKAEYFDNPRTAWFFRAMGQIPIHRVGGSASQRALASGLEVLDAGGVLGIYPEGTRSPDGRLYKGHTGVARIALASGVAVVPVACTGTAAVQPIGVNRPRFFRPVQIALGAPLRWPQLAGRAEDPVALRQATDEIMAAIRAMSGQETVDAYAKRSSDDEDGEGVDPVAS